MQKGDPKAQLPPTSHMFAAAQAGALTLAMTNPIWVVKTRLCLQYGPGAQVPSDPSKSYKGMMDALYKIAKYEGIRGLYKVRKFYDILIALPQLLPFQGFVPGLWGVSHGAIQFMTYEEMKCTYNNFKQQPIDTKLVSQSRV